MAMSKNNNHKNRNKTYIALVILLILAAIAVSVLKYTVLSRPAGGTLPEDSSTEDMLEEYSPGEPPTEEHEDEDEDESSIEELMLNAETDGVPSDEEPVE